MKQSAGMALALWLCLALAGCAPGSRVDVSAWRYYRLDAPGVSLRLPDDFSRSEARDALLYGRDAELTVEIDGCGELYADSQALLSRLRSAEGEAAELVEADGAAYVRLPADGGGRCAVYELLGSDGEAYRIRAEVSGDVKEKRAAALLRALESTFCAASSAPEDAEIIQAPAAPSQLSRADCLTLVNVRSALAENWADRLDMVTTYNDRGEVLRMERTVCKAFFGLQKALAAEGVSVRATLAYGGEGEHATGLALDLALDGGGPWERVCAKFADHGFILRYSEDGAYYTGHAAEPGHIRYVGAEAAREIAERGVTLEEYLGTLPASIDYLVLVNPEHALPDDWEDRLEVVYMTNRHGEEIGVERIAFEAYCRLRDALAEEGVHLDINSAWRSVAEQKALAESYTRKYGADYVKKYVAVPGYSEHHTGLAIDLYLESMDVWAKIHARLAEFGFILRYPEGKESITGYGYEPWHVRFVGTDTAGEIAERGVTLEEYLGET